MGVGVGVRGGVSVFYVISLLLDSSSRKSVERGCVCVCVCVYVCVCVQFQCKMLHGLFHTLVMNMRVNSSCNGPFVFAVHLYFFCKWSIHTLPKRKISSLL